MAFSPGCKLENSMQPLFYWRIWLFIPNGYNRDGRLRDPDRKDRESGRTRCLANLPVRAGFEYCRLHPTLAPQVLSVLGLRLC